MSRRAYQPDRDNRREESRREEVDLFDANRTRPVRHGHITKHGAIWDGIERHHQIREYWLEPVRDKGKVYYRLRYTIIGHERAPFYHRIHRCTIIAPPPPPDDLSIELPARLDRWVEALRN